MTRRSHIRSDAAASLLVALAVVSTAWLGGGCGQQARQAGPSSRPKMTGANMGGIKGLTGTMFNLAARSGHITLPDGGSVFAWGYADVAGLMQYPGPTLIVNQGEEITVNLSNELPLPVSIVFPGHQVTASSGSAGKLTMEAAASGGTVSYSFRATHPGTYLYHSGTRPELEVEMGLVGAIIVRPYAGAQHAYNHPMTRFDRENLFVLTEMDASVHEQVEAGNFDVDLSGWFPRYWFINGRGAPDTMAEDGAPWLPHQPYSAMPRMHPGEKLLLRVVGAGRDLHPFHHHGNHARVLAVDGRLLESAPGAGPDLSHEVFTVQSVPGETVDAIFEWTGKDLGWDIYGDPAQNHHACVDGNGDKLDDKTAEYCPDHGKKIPVDLPQQPALTFGEHWSGSPYLGTRGQLPPGQGKLNTTGAFTYMWHSHTEKEMTNDDIFPGGMMTMLFIEAPGEPID